MPAGSYMHPHKKVAGNPVAYIAGAGASFATSPYELQPVSLAPEAGYLRLASGPGLAGAAGLTRYVPPGLL